MSQERVRGLGYQRVLAEGDLVFSGQQLTGEDFSGRQVEWLSSTGCHFENCRFDDMVVKSASFGAGRVMSTYIGCSFDGSRLQMGPGGHARFEDCSFEGTYLSQWLCATVEVVNCRFSGTLQSVTFSGIVRPEEQEYANRETNQFEGNDFSQATLSQVRFRDGIDLTKQHLPAGPDYLYLPCAPAQLRKAKEVLAAWEEGKAKDDIEFALLSISDVLWTGQQQLLVQLNDLTADERQAVVKLLEQAQLN